MWKHFCLIDDGADALSATSLKRVGHFELLERLGVGGFGTVWKARDTELDRTVAVKIMLKRDAQRPDLEKRFLEEAEVTGQLQHPGIPPVHDRGRLTDGRAFFAMKLIDGQTLGDLLSDRADSGQDLPRFVGIYL